MQAIKHLKTIILYSKILIEDPFFLNWSDENLK